MLYIAMNQYVTELEAAPPIVLNGNPYMDYYRHFYFEHMLT